jgi:antitoxin MazE
MIIKLTPIGIDLGLVIDQKFLELLHIDRNTPLQITVDGNGLRIRPVESEHQARVLEAAEQVMDLHEETLRKLAL